MDPSGWRLRNLGSVLERVAKQVRLQPDAVYREIGIRSHANGIFHKDAVLGRDLGDKRVFEVIEDCFVVNIVFAWEQAVARTTSAEIGMIASHRFPMYRPKNSACDIDFLTYLFKSKRGKYLLELASPGGAGRNKTLGQKEFERLTLLMPSQIEQRKIAQILGVWDEGIAVAEKLLRNSKMQRKLLSQQLLSGRKRLPEFGQPRRDSTPPNGWRLTRLGKLIKSLDAGVSVRSGDRPAAHNESGILKTSCVTSGMFRPDENKVVLDPREVARLKEPVAENTIILSRMNTTQLVGASAYVHRTIGRLYLPDRLWQLKERPARVSMRWLAQWLAGDHARHAISANATGTSGSMKNISKADVLSLKVELPPVQEQSEIARFLELQDLEISNLARRVRSLKRERSALMQQLLTGKRRVKLDPASAA